MSRILILEDDREIQSGIKELLTIKGYEVITADSVKQFQIIEKRAEVERNIDLYLLDIKLPDGTGFEACSQIRKKSEAPVIFITSCDDQESVVKGLDIGGDDYITKPFRAAELISRIQANLRRANRQVVNIYRNGDLSMNLNEYKVFRKEQEISLSATEYELLKVLIANKGTIVKRNVLFEKIWDKSGNFVEDNTLTVAMSRLKSKLGTYGEKRISYIETIRNAGYRWREMQG